MTAGKPQKVKRILLNDVRNHNHELLEIILEAKGLSTEDEVIEVLAKALKINKDRFCKPDSNIERVNNFLKRHEY